MMKKTWMALVLVFTLWACNDYRRQISEQVKELEEETIKNFDKEKASKLLSAYDKFIAKFPGDTTCKGFMVKGAEVSILNQDGDKALMYINDFLTKYPDDARAGTMQFKKAMVYDLLKMDQPKALAEYEVFLQKYPNHPLKKDAENAVLLIKDPEAFTRMLTGGDSVLTDSTVVNAEMK